MTSNDDAAYEPPFEPSTSAGEHDDVDFSEYELGKLGDDIRSLVDVPGAVLQAAKYALAIPIGIALLTWIAYGSRMAGWALVPFTVIAAGLSLLGAIVIGGFFVTRRRLDTVADASNRVVTVIGDMHGDVARIRGGQSETSVQKVAVGLLENAIFPAVFGTVAATAETALGPLGKIASQVTKVPMAMVQKSVVTAIGSLPDHEIGDMATNSTETAAALADLTTEYTHAKDRVEGIVARVSRAALGSVLGLAVVASIPLLIWLGLGFVLT